MRRERVESDLTVIGGGLAGVCAALAAARNGRSVALVTNRPVLGGNSSSEVRVWVVGATAHGYNHFAREGGIMGELFVENQYRNKWGNPYLWDALLYEKVREEPGIGLFLNTDVRDVTAHGEGDDRAIDEVMGWMMGSEREIAFASPLFVDATGDGLVGHLAGAEYRMGREARSEHGESWAPEVADDVMLGSTMFFYTKDAGHPVRFVPPSFALDVAATTIPDNRIIRAGDDGCAYWWIETGGMQDIVHENDAIRDELWAAIYGIWDYIKNSGRFDAENMTLEWVGSLPGKREYRRFTGDHTLTQDDVFEQRDQPDQVAFGGWSIDLHPPGGMYAQEGGARQRYADGVYPIPYRSLYSRNVGNMLMAGRDISASHVAFGSTRVMATCATVGQAVGTAAALAVERGVLPRDVDAHALQQRLLADDGSLVGVRRDADGDLAARARVSASSTLTRLVAGADERLPLDVDVALVVPPGTAHVDLDVDAASDGELSYTISVPDRPQNYVPGVRSASGRVAVAEGRRAVRIPVAGALDGDGNRFVRVHAAAGVTVGVSRTRPPGTLALRWKELGPTHERPQQLREWDARPFGDGGLAFEAEVDGAFAPSTVVDGYQRPFGGPHAWVSATGDAWPELVLDWDEPVDVGRVELLFDDDVNEDLVNLHHHVTEAEVMPTLVRDYDVEGGDGGRWTTLAQVRGNRVRRRVHALDEPLTARSLRVRVLGTNGAPSAHVVSVRVVAPE